MQPNSRFQVTLLVQAGLLWAGQGPEASQAASHRSRGPRPPWSTPSPGPATPTPHSFPETRPPLPTCPHSLPLREPRSRCLPSPPLGLALPACAPARLTVPPQPRGAQGLPSSHQGGRLPGCPVQPQNLQTQVPGPRGPCWSHGLGKEPPNLCQGCLGPGAGTAVRLLAGLNRSTALWICGSAHLSGV